ncbi:hypothetical protein Q9251_03000 [Alkalihalobacillus macyae]|uniref:hypothetical protein n=1 Tax=Guptibacillus hwajinpoensis TaxID=208199 RepID=UPI00273B931B|nr:hypothetical protein [Alkalihalobacillus macyae]MDP4549843.1 hypothetical protein [Alkalihalobacillus macyae]
MADIYEASDYIASNVIDNEDWIDSDEERQNRIFNVANSTLVRKFKGKVIPDAATYEFCAVLAVVYNDTNKLQQQGIASVSTTGIESVVFKQGNVKHAGSNSADEFIPPIVYELIEDENGSVNNGSKWGSTVRYR